MTRTEFLDALCKGLHGLPMSTQNEIITDYVTHFNDAAAAGRDEAEVAAALGDPTRLARELKAEAGVKSWETSRTPSSALGAVLALIGLGALDIFVLLPIFGGLVGTLIGIFTGAIGIFIVGGIIFAVGPFLGAPGGVAAALLLGFGLMSGAAAFGSLMIALGTWLVNGIVWYARLHYRVLKPALDA